MSKKGTITRAVTKHVPDKGDLHLSQFGYALRNLPDIRHKSIDKAVEKHGYTPTLRRLNAISMLMRNTEHNLSEHAKSDIHYLQKHHKK